MFVLAISKPNKLSVNQIGTEVIKKQIFETNYIVNVPARKEKYQIDHVTLLKPYSQRAKVVNILIGENCEFHLSVGDLDFLSDIRPGRV